MIIDKLSEIEKYKGCYNICDKAIQFLKTIDSKDLQVGRYELDEDNLFVNVFTYDTLPKEKGTFEGHKKYIDVHVVLNGEEQIACAHKSDLQETVPYNEQDDFCGYDGSATTYSVLKQGDFAITFPQDIHMPKLVNKKTCKVKKAVMKIKID